MVQHSPSLGGACGVLLMFERGHGPALAGAEELQILAGLAGTQDGAVRLEGFGELGGGPGAVLVEQAVERPGDLLAPCRVPGWTRSAPS